MESNNLSSRKNRRNIACDECKRRKIRCSADPVCSSCARDKKTCVYSTPTHRLSALQKTVHQYEALIESINKIWAVHVPHVSLEDALKRGPATPSSSSHGELPRPKTETGVMQPSPGLHELAHASSVDTLSISDAVTPEQSNAEDYEFDESQDLGNTIDGMGFLTAEASKSGYTGPQSGIAALKLLRSLPSGQQHGHSALTSIGTASTASPTSHRQTASVDQYISDYFKYYHPAYPLLHEGLFRARLFGAVAKPRDGSWPLLYNMVIAMGAFAGDSAESDIDWHFYQVAWSSISLSVVEKGSLSYVQGLTIMANYLQKRNRPNAGFALIGVAWSMAMAIGLHREFGTASTTPYIMEQRRRTWWTLYCFVSGAQLTLGRPPASLIGINLRLPSNLDDASLSVDMIEVPPAQQGPATTTCLIAQTGLMQIANDVQTELLTSQVPSLQNADVLRQRIENWRAALPSCFDEQLSFPTWFDLPRRVLLWRAYQLRIVLDRPFLFQAITNKADLSKCQGPVWECMQTAEACATSICDFLDRYDNWRRGFAWYATYWLISASFVQAVCFAYSPVRSTEDCAGRDYWRPILGRAVLALEKLGSAHIKAAQAQRVLERLLGNSPPTGETFHTAEPWNQQQFAIDTSLIDFSINYFGMRDPGDPGGMDFLNSDTAAFDGIGDDPAWLQPNAPNAELSDAAGGITLQNYADRWQPHG